MARYRRRLTGLAVVVVLVAAYAVVGFFAVPHFARREAVGFVRTHYGRTLTLGDVRFNPFTLNLDVTQASLPDADGAPLVSFARLHVGLKLASLWRFAPSFDQIRLEQPYARLVIRPDGALNFADLGKGFAPAPAPPPARKSAPMRLYITELAVQGGSVSFEDRTRQTPFRADLKPIEFDLRDFSTTGATGNDYALNASSPEGGRLTWSGSIHLEPLASRGVFEIADVKARTLWSYLRASLPFEIDSGVVGVKGGYQLISGAGPLAIQVDVGSTTVTGLGVKPKGAAEDSVRLARLEVEGTQIDLTRRRLDVARVRLAGGDLKAWLAEDGRLNLLDLMGPAAAAPASAATDPPVPAAAPRAAPQPAGAAWTVAVPDIAVEGFKVSAEDRQFKPAANLELYPLNVRIAGFNTSPEDKLDITVDTAVNTTGKLAARAQVAAHAGSVSAHVEVQHLDLTALQPAIAHYTSMTLVKADLGARFDLERSADGKLEVKGAAAVHDLKTVDDALRNDFVRWRDLRIADVSYRSSPMQVRIGSVTALEPYVRMIIAPDRTTNIAAILTPPGAKPKAPSAAPPPRREARAAPAAPPKPLTPFPLTIGAVRIVNGSANYTDLWIKPSFSLGMEALNGALTGLSSDPSSRARLQLDGKVARYSPLHIGGEVNLLSAALYTDITMSFKDLDLTVANPYSGYFVGYKIDKGKLSVDVSYKVQQRQLTASQHFVVDQFELGDAVNSPGAVHLPLKLAVALLKDRHGVIDLNLPMSGSLDDPHFRIGPIIWKVFVNTIIKAATAPFALLGHLFGGGEHMNIVEFSPGSAELDPSAQQQLAALVKALTDRPQLKLDVPIVYSAALDRPPLAQRKVDDELKARALASRQGRKHPQDAAELALADPVQHYQLLIEQYHADLGKEAPLPASVVAIESARKGAVPPLDPAIADLNAALITHAAVADADLEKLGKDRARAIEDALVSGKQVDASRVFIINAAPKPDTDDKVRVELAVK